MSEDYEEKETYLFLDFDGRLNIENFEKTNPFLRVADLHTPNPLVQVNDFLYKGTYENAMGTNLFFVEEEAPSNRSVFRKDNPINLKYLLSQAKVLNLRNVRLKSSTDIEETNKKVDVNLDHDYETVLKKLADGTISLDDLSSNCSAEATNTDTTNFEEQQTDEKSAHDVTVSSSSLLEEQLEQVPDETVCRKPYLLQKYEKLCKLARRPVYRVAESELVHETEEKYKKSFEFHNIERQIFQRSNSFPVLNFNINEETLSNAVDIDRCILFGVIPDSIKEGQRLSKDIKEKLLKIENFQNLSLPARYFVLKRELHLLEIAVKETDQNDLKKVDEFGRTPLDTLNIFRKLVSDLGNYLSGLKRTLEANERQSMEIENSDEMDD